MLLILHSVSSDIRVTICENEAADKPLASYEQIKCSYVPETGIGRIYATQNDNNNDNNNDNKINPETNFKHHHPLITPPRRFAPNHDMFRLCSTSNAQTKISGSLRNVATLSLFPGSQKRFCAGRSQNNLWNFQHIVHMPCHKVVPCCAPPLLQASKLVGKSLQESK